MQKVNFLPDSAMKGYDKTFSPNKFFFEIDCFLKIYDVVSDDGKFIPAGNYINEWCRMTDINQRMIIVTLQREQGLLNHKVIETIKPYWKYLIIDQATGKKRAVNVKNKNEVPKLESSEMVSQIVEMKLLDWACGCGVPDDGLNPEYKGFEKQIRCACYSYINAFKKFKKDTVKELINEPPVIAENACTYALLCYTPHVIAGLKTKEYYERYFGDTL